MTVEPELAPVLEAMSIEGLSRKRSGSIVIKYFESRCFRKSYCKELSHRCSEVFPCPGAGSGERGGLAHSQQGGPGLLAWVVAAKSAPIPTNPAPPLTAVMTKAKAAPKIGSRRNSKASHSRVVLIANLDSQRMSKELLSS